ncbi:MAG TPA: TonB-dependent receptor, partial [Steroidobacteraceae bacterium]|nr:TonB-dependent receptor [Steroidobacteraceae bacterium]
VDAIVAEDIADFPDLNLAESLQRVSGVSIARDAGEGRTISVRGLGPEFTRVRLNGMEAMSSNGGTDQAGGTNRARQFDFNTFASDLFNEITVRKTASAGVEEGSLGATVDLRTARPFDYKEGLTLVGSLTGSYNSLAEEVDPRAAFLISSTFADGMLGALLSVAYTERHLVDEGSSTVRWQRLSSSLATNLAASPGYSSASTIAQVNAAFVPRIPRYDYYEHDQDRLGVTSSIQFKPVDGTSIDLDLLYAKFEATRSETFLEVPNFSSASPSMTVRQATIDNNNTLLFAEFNNVDIRSENRYDELSTEFKQVTLSGSQQLTDTLKLNALVGYSESDHQNPIQTTLLFDWNNIPQFVYNYGYDRAHPELNYGATNVSSTVNGTPQQGATSTVNSNGWYLSQIRLRPQTAFNSFMNYIVDADWQFADAFSLKGGLQFKKFEFETTELRRSNGTTANLEILPTTSPLMAIPIASYARQFTFPNSVGIPAWSNRTMTLPDIQRAAQVLGMYDRNAFPLGIEPALANNREVFEEDSGAFVEFNVDTQLGNMPLRGNLGLRYVRTEQESKGYTFLSGAPVQATARRDYSDTLPSLNVALDVLDNLVLRLGAAKVMSRPALGALTPGGTVGVSGASRVANLGNPRIDPTRAKTYDIAAEWYFAQESLLSLALFRKDITSRPQALSLTGQVFTGNPFGIPDSVAIAACGADPACSPSAPIWNFNTTINGP